MPVLRFDPSGKECDVPAGTPLLDAARKAGVEIPTACGGTGSCGKCVVRVVSGDVFFDRAGVLSREQIKDRLVLACRSAAGEADSVIEIPRQRETDGSSPVGIAGDMALVDPALVPAGPGIDPLVTQVSVLVAPPEPQDGRSDVDRLSESLREALNVTDVIFPLGVVRQVAGAVRAENGRAALTVGLHENICTVVGLSPGSPAESQYGVAVDLGTTTVAVSLVSLRDGAVVATDSDYNAQVACGLDVISRINYARKPGRLGELREHALGTINSLIERIATVHGELCGRIPCATISGNTTMVHLLLGLDPEHLRLAPYTPTVLRVPTIAAGEVGLCINPDGPVRISPLVGSYVGGDITAGLLCTDISAGTDEICMFLDIGTNGELVVGNKEFLVACACSAGPAFEGGGISCGMRASPGAIDKVEVDRATGIARYETIGRGDPRGICGSGMISLVASLFLSGRLDASGKLDRTRECAAIRVDGRRALYTVVPADRSGTGEAITVSEIDVESLIRAKAAIYSACSLMLGQLDLDFSDVAKIYVAGGFGASLDLTMATVIGLVPDLPKEKFCYVGNASLAGTCMTLVSREHRERQEALAHRMTYVELNTDPAYMDQYTGALFLPHTDNARFPSVAGRFSRDDT